MGDNRQRFEAKPDIQREIKICIVETNKFFWKVFNLKDLFISEEELTKYYFTFDSDEDYCKAIATKYGFGTYVDGSDPTKENLLIADLNSDLFNVLVDTKNVQEKQ